MLYLFILFCILCAFTLAFVLLCPVRLTRKQPVTKKKIIELKCDGPIAHLFLKWNWAASTIPVPFCVLILYWVDTTMNDPDAFVRIHEFVHVAQDEKNSFFLTSWAGYFVEMIKQWFSTGSLFDAYKANKFERAAYAVEADAAYGRTNVPEWAK